MENAEEILQSLDEFSKVKPKDIPRELEEYLCFVAKTGDPVYQWPLVKNLFREKLINVITEFYESCPSVEIPPCPNVEAFNYDVMKNFILEKLESFASAPFTVQRICELLTTPRKEYNRIDKYMRALEKNILVVSTREPGQRRSTENGDSILNGLETDSGNNTIGNDVHIEVDMEETPIWSPKSDMNDTHNYDAVKPDFKPEIQESSTEQLKPLTEMSFATHDLDLNRIVPNENSSAVESVIACNSTGSDVPTQENITEVTSTSSGDQLFIETPQSNREIISEHSYISNINVITTDTFTNDVEKSNVEPNTLPLENTEITENQEVETNYSEKPEEVNKSDTPVTEEDKPTVTTNETLPTEETLTMDKLEDTQEPVVDSELHSVSATVECTSMTSDDISPPPLDEPNSMSTESDDPKPTETSNNETLEETQNHTPVTEESDQTIVASSSESEVTNTETNSEVNTENESYPVESTQTEKPETSTDNEVVAADVVTAMDGVEEESSEPMPSDTKPLEKVDVIETEHNLPSTDENMVTSTEVSNDCEMSINDNVTESSMDVQQEEINKDEVSLTKTEEVCETETQSVVEKVVEENSVEVQSNSDITQ